MKISKRLVLIVLSMILAVNLFSSATGEEAVHMWNCPRCGRIGNTGKFCGTCGKLKPAWLKAPSWPDTMFSFDMSVDEMNQRVKELLQNTLVWEENYSYPQTIDEFPLLPENYSDLLNDISRVDNSLSLSGNTEVTWKTGLRDWFDSIAPGSTVRPYAFRQYDGLMCVFEKDAYLTNDSYVKIISDYSSEDLCMIGLETRWGCSQNEEGEYEEFAVEYFVENGQLTGKVRAIIRIQTSEGYIIWEIGYNSDLGTDVLDIDYIHGYDGGAMYTVRYDLKSGQYIEIEAEYVEPYS